MTLIELLFVVAILGALLALALQWMNAGVAKDFS